MGMVENEAIKGRASNYEVIRIVAAVFIILNHIPLSDSATYSNTLIKDFFFLGGKFGVNLFVILGAWFLSDGGRFKSARVIRIIEQTVFFGAALNLASVLLGCRFGLRELLSGFRYWYPFGYVIMLILTPFLNSIPVKYKKRIIILGGVIACWITVWGYVNSGSIAVRLSSKVLIIGPVWFCYVYVVISYIRSKDILRRFSWKCSGFIFAFSYMTMYIVVRMTGGYFIRAVTSPVCFISALSLFNLFRGIDMGYSRAVNRIAALTFAAYLIQTHKLFSGYIWEELMQFSEASEQGPIYVAKAFAVVPVIFVLAALMEFLYRLTVSIPVVKSANSRLASFCDRHYERCMSRTIRQEY